MLNMIKTFGRNRKGPAPQPFDPKTLREVEQQAMQVGMDVRKMGEAEGRMWNKVWGAAVRKPSTMTIVARIMFQYAQARHMFEMGNYWEPGLSAAPSRAPVSRDEPATV
jgi:hypothetical protein